MSERVIPAVLGWSNEGTGGGANLRLYARDAGESPRWDNSLGRGGRTVERVIIERDGGMHEGDRYLVVRLGGRFFSHDQEAELAAYIEAWEPSA